VHLDLGTRRDDRQDVSGNAIGERVLVGRLAAVLRGGSAEEIELTADLAKRILTPPKSHRSVKRRGKR